LNDEHLLKAEVEAQIKGAFDAVEPKDLLPHDGFENKMIAPSDPLIPGVITRERRYKTLIDGET